jgi:amino acid adenylation domain-containing protein
VEVQGWSEVPRGLPLFESIVVFENYPVDRSKGGDAGLKVVGVEAEERTNYPLNLIAMVGEGVSFRLTYERSRFADEAMERVLRQLTVVLDGMVEHAEEAISRLPLMSEGERAEVLERSCGEAKEYEDKERCVHELVAREASRHPERMAVVCEGEGISYGELNRRANQLGRYLRRKGVGPEVLVGIAMERSVEMVVGILGILKAGGAYVPLDVEYPKERLRYMLEDSGVGVLVSESAVLQKLPETLAGVEVVRMDEEEEQKKIAEESGEDFASGVGCENLAYMIYTSGSTGKPKGAMNEHRGLTNRLLWMQERFGLGEEDVVLQKTPISFDVSVWELLWAVMVGGRLVMARPGGHRDGRYLAEVIEREKVTTLHFVPSMLQAFLQEEGLAEKCVSVKRVISSGEALGWELQERFYERMGAGAGDGGVKLYNLYGPTEAAIDVTCWECEPGLGAGEGGGVVPIGRAIANVQMYVLDEKQEVVPEGVSGELYIGGVQVGRGYWKREELTGERFVRNPYGEGKLYRTGDVGRYVGNGAIEYQGRRDEQVKVRGYRIELGEIEAVLQEHAGVKEAAVEVREVRGAGEGTETGQGSGIEAGAGTPEKRLVGYVVLAGGVKTSELRRYLKERLPEYMVPGVWVEMERLPVTANGKLDRKGLPEPGGERPELESGYEEPRTETEKKLAEIWAQVLGVEKVGVHDNFFDLGGHSMLATQIISRTRKILQIELPLRRFFEVPTIAEQASAISEIETGNRLALLATELAELHELEQLSEAEAKRLLEEELRAGSVQ